MAKLIAVCRSDDYQFERRQLPLPVDESLTMVIQFSDSCIDCEHVCGIKQRDLEHFVQKFDTLDKDEIASEMMVTSKEILMLLAQMVPCVGCRRSVERLFSELVESGHPGLEPLIITPNGVLSIDRNYLFDPRAIYALFYIHGAKLLTVVDAIPKNKKNKRCNLHSLDTHKSRTTSNWVEIWDVLSDDCREEVVVVDSEGLLDTLETYLRKHRFCTECKSKVMRAYNILVGDLDCSKEKGYCSSLYEGLRCCPQERHIHIKCNTAFLGQLICRAEPELIGSHRDRHAKTLDIAQEEVLACLGIHTYERLHRIWQKLRAEEQTWEVLFYLGVHALKKRFELALEKKRGISALELMCEEIEEEERAREQKRELKREKRKKKRSKQNVCESETCDGAENNTENVLCKCDDVSVDDCKKNVQTPQADLNSNTSVVSAQSCRCDGGKPLSSNLSPMLLGSGRCSDASCCDGGKPLSNKSTPLGGSRSSDAGYSSGPDGCESCCVPNDGSDLVWSEGVCNHEREHSYSLDNLEICRRCGSRDTQSPFCGRKLSQRDLCTHRTLHNQAESHREVMRYRDGHNHFDVGSHRDGTSHRDKVGDNHKHGVGSIKVPVMTSMSPNIGAAGEPYNMMYSLQDMLEQPCSSDEEDTISEADIQSFKANHNLLQRQRLELRETLRQRFHNMQQRGGVSSESVHSDLDRLTEQLCNM